MKSRKRKPRPRPLLTRKIHYAYGPSNDFWLFREGERAYNDYWDLLGRKDAPVCLAYDVVEVLRQPLKQTASTNPSGFDGWPGFGLHNDGLTIINQTGGAAFSAVCRKAGQQWAHGPELLVITHGTYTIYGSHKPPKPYRFKVDRAPLVRDLEILAEWGEKVATGAFFILHVGL